MEIALTKEGRVDPKVVLESLVKCLLAKSCFVHGKNCGNKPLQRAQKFTSFVCLVMFTLQFPFVIYNVPCVNEP